MLAQRLRRAFRELSGRPGRKSIGGLGSGNWYSGGYMLGDSTVPGDRISAAREVGNGLLASALMSPVKWVQRALPDAPLALERVGPDGIERLDESHPLLRLLNRPNEFHTLPTILQAVIYSYIIDGNAYLVKQRAAENGTDWHQNVTGQVRELWYVPHWRMSPESARGSSEYITHYKLQRDTGGNLELPVENVIHFRNGIDPRCPRRGLSLIESEMREIWTDQEAARFTAGLLQNSAIPGLMVTPKGDSDGAVIPDAETTKRELESKFGGRNRGRMMVFSVPTDVKQLAFDPKSMDLHHVRNTVEERVCAAIGIPASVVGFGTGLQQTKVGATMRDQIRLAWTGCIVPMQDAFASQLQLSLLPEFESDAERYRIVFDRSGVQALQEDQDAKVKRLNTAVQGGWMTIGEAREQAGLEAEAAHDVFLRPLAMIEEAKAADGERPPFPARA